MIDQKYPTDAFEDAIEATAYMATALLNRGELLLPQRIREHIADGTVVVHLIRGEDDVARCEATLTSESRLSGIDWPADVKPRTSLLVLCPRGGASHDIGVVLPEIDRPHDLPATQETVVEPVSEIVFDSDDVEEVSEVSFARPEDWREIDVQIIRENGGPANYEVPTTLRLVSSTAPTETIAAVPADGWPADEPDAFEEDPAEQTAIVPAVGVIEWPTYDYRPRWRRALAWVRTNTTPTRAVYAAATGGTFLGSLLTWLVTR